MRYKKARVAGVIVLLTLLSLGFFQRHVFATVAIGIYDYSEIGTNVYVDNLFSSEESIAITVLVEQAKERVASKFGAIISDPVFIASSNLLRADKFFPGRLIPGRITNTPWGQYIPLTPDGLNIDVIAHELLHAEIFSRLGFIKSSLLSAPKPLQSLPIWFNEGIGMQVDYRESKAWSYIQAGVELPPVSTLESGSEFFTGDRALHYAASSVEVSTWLESNEDVDLYAFIDQIRNGAEFHQLYKAVGNVQQ